MCMNNVLPACMYVYHICVWYLKKSKKVMGSKLELKVVVGPWIKTWVFWKSNKYSKFLSYLSSP